MCPCDSRSGNALLSYRPMLIQLSTFPTNRDVLMKRKALLKDTPPLNTAALSMHPFGDYKVSLHGQPEMDKL